MAYSLHTVPVDIVYQILDNLDTKTIIFSCFNVYKRLDDVIDTYRRYQTLTQLNLWNNRIGVQGAQHLSVVLRNNTTLTELNLSTNGIGAQWIEHLSDALRHNTALTVLNLFGNDIGSREAKHLSNAFQINTTLTELNLEMNNRDDRGQRCLTALKRNNSWLKLSMR